VRARRWYGEACGALGLILVAVAAFAFSTRHADLNFGPGDSPFVSGFERDHDVVDKTGWHWTTYDARVDLPLRARGATLDFTLRYARVFREEAAVEVSIGGLVAGSFRAGGGDVVDTTVRATPVSGPLTIGLRTDSHERRDLGLRMDRLAVEVASGPGLKLAPSAALRPVLAAVLLGACLLALGAGRLGAGVAVLAFALGFAVLARSDLFGAWRLTHAAPMMLLLSTAALFALRAVLERFGLLEGNAGRVLASAALVCMLFRLGLVSQPAFYYPDLMTHARVVETIRSEGPRFFENPAKALAAQGAWTKPVMGRVSSLPYAVMFHAPFALPAAVFDWSRDEIETALKSVACLISVLPILLAGALASRLGLPPEGALALAVLPTHASRLSLALLPSLTGHAFDLGALLLLALAFSGKTIPSRRLAAWVFVALFAGHLAYTSSVINEGVFTGLLAGLLLARGGVARASGLRLVAVEACAALLAFAVYYRHFVGDVFALAARGLATGGGSQGAGGSVYAVEGFWSLLVERTNAYFGWTWTLLALAALLAGSRRRELRRSAIVLAWVLSYLVLILLRAKIPDVFRYGHETLFVAPLIALLAASSLVDLGERGGLMRVAAWLAGLGLLAVSIGEQVVAFAGQFGNAL
jgi:hypothetical protein